MIGEQIQEDRATGRKFRVVSSWKLEASVTKTVRSSEPSTKAVMGSPMLPTARARRSPLPAASRVEAHRRGALAPWCR